ncbi:hypothetical protein SAMN04488557_0331 [Hyphomicrobium facile]|uniref:Uncharacterized protein n=2 Tax=Hyphomicrobium facile TaxID=51670 RepID=A0A1I7MUN5_9HYPH|nr:hypothetical protein SAMN04488557_0331 [Hyphomicrobium facile]
MPGLLRPEDLQMIASDAEMEELKREQKLSQSQKQQQRELREAFMSRKVAPEAVERINNAVRIAAQNGHHHLQVITFPSNYCSDGGRRINIADPEWPTSLTGFAKDAFEFYDEQLRPLGYRLRAEIVSFPGGMPGEVALSLVW